MVKNIIDMSNKNTNKLLISVSKFISNVFNPLTSLVLYFAYFSYHYYTIMEALFQFLPIFIILILPTAIWIFWNVKIGKYSNMDVSDRKQRNSLYIFIGIMMLIYLAYKYLFENTADFPILFLFFLLILMHISNFFIKSSMHTALNIYATALFFSQNMSLGLVWFILAIIVGITRIILKRHTIPEVLMGGFLAIIISCLYLYVQIQN